MGLGIFSILRSKVISWQWQWLWKIASSSNNKSAGQLIVCGEDNGKELAPQTNQLDNCLRGGQRPWLGREGVQGV